MAALVDQWATLSVSEISASDMQDFFCQRHPDSEWRRIVGQEADAILSQNGTGGVVVRNELGEVVGHSYGAFLMPEFSRRIRHPDCMWVNAEARQWIEAGHPTIVPTPERDVDLFLQVASAGLHLHMFAFDWVGDVCGGTMTRVRRVLAEDMLYRYQGAPIRRITVEATGPYREEGEKAGFRTLKHYPSADGVLMVADSRSSANNSNPWLLSLVDYRQPRLRLAPRQRRILYFFGLGLSDEEIAAAVALSPKSMKTYWDRIFACFEEVLDLGGSRNKRREIAAYLRIHPEEAWPSM